MEMSKTMSDNQKLCEPGFWETLKETFLGVRRPFDCIQVEVTSRCPNRCTYCPQTVLRDKWRKHDLDWDAFTRLWPLMRRTSRVHLQGWGEPLLNPLFFDMVALARKAGCSVSTTTSGWLMTPELARNIVNSGLDILAFSLAGTDPLSNSSRRGIPFERVCEAISLLQTVRRELVGVHLEVHIAYLLLASNLDAVSRLPELMKRLGVHAAVVSTLDYIPSTSLAEEAIAPDDTPKLARVEAVLKEAAASARESDMEFHYELPDKDAPGNDCRENISRYLFVSADGSVSPCVYLNMPVDRDDPNRRVFGNIREQDPLEIWEHEAFRGFREHLAQGDPDTPCRACPKRMMR
jgi:radical SAM protein with 4Fe4S-binding SPASM domain